MWYCFYGINISTSLAPAFFRCDDKYVITLNEFLERKKMDSLIFYPSVISDQIILNFN